jgi:hypothetical protein
MSEAFPSHFPEIDKDTKAPGQAKAERDADEDVKK